MNTCSFICGCGHSGTTLLATMFAAHPKFFVPLYETECFFKLEGAERRWTKIVQAAREDGKVNVLEKTPRHIRHLHNVRDVVDNPKFILMVRDGWDVTGSIQKRYGSALKGANRWLSDNKIVIDELASEDTILCKYEDLVNNPEAELKRLCDFLKVDFCESMLAFHQTSNLWFGQNDIREGSGVAGKEHKALRNWQVNQPLFSGVGRGRERLLAEQIEELPTSEMSEMLKVFGYEPSLS